MRVVRDGMVFDKCRICGVEGTFKYPNLELCDYCHLRHPKGTIGWKVATRKPYSDRLCNHSLAGKREHTADLVPLLSI